MPVSFANSFWVNPFSWRLSLILFIFLPPSVILNHTVKLFVL
nr:MAG TPA: hypothetical protein [Caudoviricetes sp.]